MEYDDNWVWINKISLQIFKNIVSGSCYKNMLESHEQLLEATTKISIVLLV